MIRSLCFLFALVSAMGVSAQTIDLTDASALPFPPETVADPDAPRDFVLLGTDLVEIAVALGAGNRILARPDDDSVAGVEDTPHKMREFAGVEGIAAMRPGMVVASNVRFQRLLDGLSNIKIENRLVDRTLPATEKVSRLAELLGLEQRGVALNEAIKADYARAEIITRADVPLKLLHVSKQGAGGNFSAGGARTGVHNLIERVGAENAAAGIGMDRYRSVTPEGVILMAPDVVLISERELPAFGDLAGIWIDYPGLVHTPAGRNKRLIIMREMHVKGDAASSGIATLALAQALARMFP